MKLQLHGFKNKSDQAILQQEEGVKITVLWLLALYGMRLHYKKACRTRPNWNSTGADIKVAGYLHLENSCHSALSCQNEKLIYWIRLHRIHPSPGSLIQMRAYEVCQYQKAHISCSLAHFGDFCLKRLHGRAMPVIKGPENFIWKSFVSKTKIWQRQIHLLSV